MKKYYRGGGEGMDSPPRGASVWDLVVFEREELGNLESITPLFTEETLRKIPAARTQWLARTRKGAAYYGRVEALTYVDPVELVADNQDGYIVLERRAFDYYTAGERSSNPPKKKKPSMNGPSPDAEDGAVITKGYKVFDGANLEGADLSGVSFKDVAPKYSLSQLNLKDADLRGADFTGRFLKGINFEGADLRGADFRGADLRGARFDSLSLRDADFTDADLEGAQFYGADLEGAVFEGANLREAKISYSPLGSVNFANSCMIDADIYGPPEPVRGLSFQGADLRGASMEKLFVQDSDFKGALLSLSRYQLDEYFNCMYEFPSGGECFTPAIIEVLTYAKRHGCRGLEMGAQAVMDQFREALDVFHANRRAEAIRAGAYLGFVEGLWIHQTDDPKFQYHGEFCVSPYSDEEERFYAGGRVFGVIMSGAAELFADDVWSAPDVFGRLIPNRFVVREGHHKEAFIHGDEARIIGLTYPAYAEKVPKWRAVIKEWQNAGYLTVPIVL